MAGMYESAKKKASEMLNKMSPSARKLVREGEGGDQVVRNAYEKAVATGDFNGTLEEFAKERGMTLRKNQR